VIALWFVMLKYFKGIFLYSLLRLSALLLPWCFKVNLLCIIVIVVIVVSYVLVKLKIVS